MTDHRAVAHSGLSQHCRRVCQETEPGATVQSSTEPMGISRCAKFSPLAPNGCGHAHAGTDQETCLSYECRPTVSQPDCMWAALCASASAYFITWPATLILVPNRGPLAVTESPFPAEGRQREPPTTGIYDPSEGQKTDHRLCDHRPTRPAFGCRTMRTSSGMCVAVRTRYQRSLGPMGCDEFLRPTDAPAGGHPPGRFRDDGSASDRRSSAWLRGQCWTRSTGYGWRPRGGGRARRIAPTPWAGTNRCVRRLAPTIRGMASGELTSPKCEA